MYTSGPRLWDLPPPSWPVLRSPDTRQPALDSYGLCHTPSRTLLPHSPLCASRAWYPTDLHFASPQVSLSSFPSHRRRTKVSPAPLLRTASRDRTPSEILCDRPWWSSGNCVHRSAEGSVHRIRHSAFFPLCSRLHYHRSARTVFQVSQTSVLVGEPCSSHISGGNDKDTTARLPLVLRNK